MTRPEVDGPASVTSLPWDSAHFDFPVGRLIGEGHAIDDLERALRQAHREGFHLVYCTTNSDQVLPESLLGKWRGLLVDKKVTFTADLTRPEPTIKPVRAPGFQVTEYPQSMPTASLLALGVAAGEWSRFRRDPSICAERFRDLYETWVRRSTLRELADVVLVIPGTTVEHLGIATISRRERMAQIGLIAIDDSVRGQGLGSLLMQEARKWMIEAGADSATVVTQLDNVGACRLYQRHGYAASEVQHYYHFWLVPEQSSPAAAATISEQRSLPS